MPDIAFLVARICLGLIYVVSGWLKLTGIAATTAYLNARGVPNGAMMAYVVGGIELGGGALIMVGFLTRWVALGMAVFTLVTIYIGHPFWTMTGADLANNRTQALKNLAIFGGFLLLAVSGPGRFSIDGARRG
jgi:putative oxidoreductase